MILYGVKYGEICFWEKILDDDERFIKERDKLNFIMRATDEAFKESQKNTEVK